MVVLWGGSDDVARNKSDDSLKHILDVVRNSNHINVIVMTVPHRRDLVRNSCVNNQVEASDGRLWEQDEDVKKCADDKCVH
jgi:hypothetical protein